MPHIALYGNHKDLLAISFIQGALSRHLPWPNLAQGDMEDSTNK